MAGSICGVVGGVVAGGWNAFDSSCLNQPPDGFAAGVDGTGLDDVDGDWLGVLGVDDGAGDGAAGALVAGVVVAGVDVSAMT